MAVLFTNPFPQFLDDNGSPLSGGKLFTYAAGTTTNKATYTTAAATVQNPNPVILDAAGRAVIFIEGSYRFDLFDSDNNLIKSVDNVTSFTSLTDSASAFFQSFSGDSNTTAFVVSENLGADEKTLMVFVDDGLNEYVTNGNFATDTDWTKGSGWVIGSGVATATTASTALTQDSELTLIEGQSYNITYTITRSAGTVTPSIGGTDGETRNADGTYTETIIAGSAQAIAFTGDSFSGTVDNVSVTKIQSSGANILNPNQYTLDGTSLTFVTAPASGTNNILVFAPSQLVGAASAAASAAQAAESAAVVARDEAQAAAGLLDVASTTSVAIGIGTKTFTIAADKGLTAGQFVLVDSDADGSNYMYGQITDYTGTSLEVNVLNVGGSGTFDDWKITLIGIQGIQGDAGAVSATSAVVAATSAGASLQSNNNTVCLSWGAGGGANLTAGGNLSMNTTNKIVNMADPTTDQDAATKKYVDDEIALIPTYTPPTTAGEVGTYMYAQNDPAAVVTFGSTVAGSTLKPTSGEGTTPVGSAQSGTWRCMGMTSNTGANAVVATLWLRIS
jgi:hypothetical protein